MLFAACGQLNSDAPGGTGSSGSGSGSSYFTVKVNTAYETDDTADTNWATCTISAASTASASGANVCTASIPEGQLYYSKLKFVLETSAGQVCSRISFHPYYAIRSVAAAFVEPEGATTVDCSVAFNLRPATCFEGAAREIVTSFPANGGVYITPGTAAISRTWELTSGNAHRQAVSNDFGNLWASNNLTDRTAAIADAITGRYFVGGAANYQDYEFECLDSLEESLYLLRILVNESNGANDDIVDWN